MFAAALHIYFNDDLEADEIDDELDTLVDAARRNGIDVTREDILDRVEEQDDAERDVVSYSWVHLNEFRLFELHGQCLPWTTPEELRSVVGELP